MPKTSDIQKIQTLHSKFPKLDDDKFKRKLELDIGVYLSAESIKDIRRGKVPVNTENDLGRQTYVDQKRKHRISMAMPKQINTLKKAVMMGTVESIDQKILTLQNKKLFIPIWSVGKVTCRCGNKVKSIQNEIKIPLLNSSFIVVERKIKCLRCLNCNTLLMDINNYYDLIKTGFYVPAEIYRSHCDRKYVKQSSDSLLHNGFENYRDESLIHLIGYNVSLYGLDNNNELRRALLKLCVQMFGIDYVEYLIESLIKSRKDNTSKNYSKAISLWEADLVHLKSIFYK